MHKKYIIVGTMLLANMLRASERDLYELVLDATEDQLLKSTARTQKHRATGKVLADKIRTQATEIFNKITAEKKAEKEKIEKQEALLINLEKTAQESESTKKQLNDLQEQYKKLKASHQSLKNIIAGMAKAVDTLSDFAKNFGK